MKALSRIVKAGLVTCLLAGPALAVQPDEIMSDPALEARARVISKDLRCLVCRNESIDESHAELARDLRLLVRERLGAGDSDEQVIDFVVDRYGEYVLLRPRNTGSNMVLWLAGPVALLVALGGGITYLRRRRPEVAGEPVAEDLSEAERKRLDELLRD